MSGTRSWIAPSSAGVTPTDGILKWNSGSSKYEPYANNTTLGNNQGIFSDLVGSIDPSSTIDNNHIFSNGPIGAIAVASSALYI